MKKSFGMVGKFYKATCERSMISKGNYHARR